MPYFAALPCGSWGYCCQAAEHGAIAAPYDPGFHGHRDLPDISVNSQELYRLGCQVWNSLGSLQLSATPLYPELRHDLQYYVRVSMGVLGHSILLGVDADVAASLAATMFDYPLATLSAADIRDALGEAANMLAGKIAALFGATEGLGLPEHLLASSVETYLQQVEILVETGALSAGQPIYLSIQKIIVNPMSGSLETKPCVS